MVDRTIKTAKTIFGIIEALQRLDGGGITEIADDLDLSPSTVHDHLTTLEGLEYVRRDGNRFVLSLKFLDHGYYARDQIELTDAVHPELEQLAADTQESAWILVEEHRWAVNIAGETGPRGVNTGERIGFRSYLHVHAAGKSILAHLPEARLEEIIDKRGLPKLTENTITDRDELRRELSTIREQGFASDRSEGIEGLCAVAAPIIVDGDVRGAVTVAGPENRLKGKKFNKEFPDAVQGAANAIELNLAYR